MNRQRASTPLLTARGYRRNGFHRVDLYWIGSNAHGFDVFRDGERIATVPASPYHDRPENRGSGAYRYHVTETATAVCSNDAAATFTDPGKSSTTRQPQRAGDRAIDHATRARSPIAA